MLKQASVGQIRSGEISRENGYLVLGMAHYPRGLKSDLTDEYRSDLAPDRDLLREWKEVERKFGHDIAFEKTDYENRFQLKPEAKEHLKILSEFARRADVYLICQCELGQRCHREMLMLYAEREFGAPIDRVFHAYPRFLARKL